jgi:hypothetical protein
MFSTRKTSEHHPSPPYNSPTVAAEAAEVAEAATEAAAVAEVVEAAAAVEAAAVSHGGCGGAINIIRRHADRSRRLDDPPQLARLVVCRLAMLARAGLGPSFYAGLRAMDEIKTDIAKLAAETLALQTLIVAFLGRLSSGDANHAAIIRAAFDDAARFLEDRAIEHGTASHAQHLPHSLRVIEELRAATISYEYKSKHGV